MKLQSVYVIDAHALMHLQTCGYSANDYHYILNQMTDKVKEESLLFPTQVVTFCRTYATHESVTMWANAVSGHRAKKSPDAEYQSIVLDIVEEISDADDDEELPALFVAAMALEVQMTMNDVSPVIVTEDKLELPTRTCLWEASQTLGLTRIGMTDYIESELFLLS